MKHRIAHDLGAPLAKQAADAAIASYRERYSKYQPVLTWTGETRGTIGLSVKGFTLTGGIEVRESSIEVDLDVPFVFRAFKGKAISAIDKEVRRWMDKAKAGDL